VAVMFAVSWGGNQFTPLLSMYQERNGFGSVTVTLLLFADVVGPAPSLLLSGGLAARIGTRPLLIVAPLAGGAGSLMIAVASMPRRSSSGDGW
jgi:MFS family permease